jgi:Ca2+-binding RTX toxin-like protein
MAFASTVQDSRLGYIESMADGTYIGFGSNSEGRGLQAQRYAADGTLIGQTVNLDSVRQFYNPTKFAASIDSNGVLTLFTYEYYLGLQRIVWDTATSAVSSFTKLSTQETQAGGFHETNGMLTVYKSFEQAGQTFIKTLVFNFSGELVSSNDIVGENLNWQTWSVSPDVTIASSYLSNALRMYDQVTSNPESFTEIKFPDSAKPTADTIASVHNVLMLANGNLLVVWHVDHQYFSMRHFSAQIVSPAGFAIGEPFRITNDLNGDFSPVLIEELENGDLLLIWRQQDEIKARILGENGQDTGIPDFTVIQSADFSPLRFADVSGNFLKIAKGNQLYSIDLTKTVGTADNDTLTTLPFTKSLEGFGGNDTLTGATRAETLSGGDGNDWLAGNGGGDLINGGAGTDTASYIDRGSVSVALDGSFAMGGDASGDRLVSIENLVGSRDGDDRLTGNSLANRIVGHGGNDTLSGHDGNDVLLGGAGFDTLNGGAGIDTLSYEQEDAVAIALDFSIGRRGAAIGDTFSSIENLTGSNTGGDNLAGNAGANVVSGLGGNDSIAGRGGNDKLYGGAGNDLLRGGAGADLHDGGAGDDLVTYSEDAGVHASLDKSIAGTGAAKGDTFVSIEDLNGSNTGNDVLAGNGVRNYLDGNGGNDTLYGRGGSDIMIGGAGADVLDGGAGFDWADYFNDGPVNVALDRSFSATGAARGDTFISIENVFGSDRWNDKISGDAGDNYLIGNGGNDTLYGRDGDDTVEGGAGKDTLSSGKGFDAFYYNALSHGGDTITDFSVEDIIAIESDWYQNFNSGYAEGVIPTYNFRSRIDNKAVDRDDYFIFRTTDDTLWFDADGSGARAAVLLARLSNGYDLKASDIYIV